MQVLTEKNARYRRYAITITALIAFFVVLIIMNIKLGSVAIGTEEIFKILSKQIEGTTNSDIIWKIRLPRALAAIILGGALALSGFLLQTFFNNPIAGPYVLGISSGARLMVAIVMVLVLSRYHTVSSGLLIVAAFIGAMMAMGFVLLIAREVQRSAMLIVSGVMIGYICSAITDFVITFADDASIVNLHYWTTGTFSGTSWEDVQVMAVVVLITALIVFLLAKPIGAYQMGEAYAQNMGVNIKSFRIILVVTSSILCACVTAFAGPVSFVGVAVPHIVKAFLKTAKPLIVIPVCFLGGAIFCLGCDLIARTLFAPMELSISSVTALFGAPIVIAVMLRKREHN